MTMAMDSSSVPEIASSDEEVVAGDGVMDLTKPEQEVASGGSTKRPKPEEEEIVDGGVDPVEVADGSIQIVEPAERKGIAFGLVETYTPEESKTGVWAAARRVLSDKEREKRRFEWFKYHFNMLRSGAKWEKRMLPVDPAAIECVLRDPPHDFTACEPPEDFHLVPEVFRSAFLRNTARVKEIAAENQAIIDEFLATGSALVEKWVYVDKDGNVIRS